jgi:uncharacterized membrane protein YphA (DoxX/SURF4 family)
MNTALWVVSGLLAVVFLGAGALKLVRSKEALAAGGFKWVQDYSANQVRLIGIAEILGAFGLIVPPLVKIAPIVAPIAAVCLVVVMIGATYTHAKFKEYPQAVITILFAILSAFVAWGRFGPYAF